jgi:hypothetical protein
MHLARNSRLARCQAAIHLFLPRITPDSGYHTCIWPGMAVWPLRRTAIHCFYCASCWIMHLAWVGRLARCLAGMHCFTAHHVGSCVAHMAWPAVKRPYIIFTAHHAGLCIVHMHLAWDGRLACCLAITHCLQCASCKSYQIMHSTCSWPGMATGPLSSGHNLRPTGARSCTAHIYLA